MDNSCFILISLCVCFAPCVEALLCWECRYSSIDGNNGGFDDNMRECNDEKFDLLTVNSDHRDNYTVECNGTCSKVKIFYDDSSYKVVSRTCLDSCMEYNDRLHNVSIDYRCCNNHYCNSASRLGYSPAWLLASIAIFTSGWLLPRLVLLPQDFRFT